MDNCVQESEQGLPGSNRRLRFWRPLCFRLHQAPLNIPDRTRTCTAGTGIRYGHPFHHGDKALPKRFELLSNSLEGCCSRPLSYGNMLRPQVAFSMFSVTIFLAKEKPPAPLTDGHDNTKDLQAMMEEESWHPCTYIPYISFGHHKQTNLPSANSPPDMLMLTLNGCICVHGVYLPFPEFLNQQYVTGYRRHREAAPFDTYGLIAESGVLQNRVSIPNREGYESSLDADPSANRNDWSRTSGLVIPNHALPQLSYIPKKCPTRDLNPHLTD